MVGTPTRPLTGLSATSTGILGAGLLTYAFLTLAGRTLGPAGFAPVSALWALVFLLGPGLFLPLQLEAARLLGPQRAERGGGHARRLLVLVASGVVLVVAAATALASGVLTERLFDGNSVLLWCLVAALATHAVTFLARGVLTGLGDFAGYGTLVFSEAAVRVALALAATLAGWRTPAAYGVAIAAAPLLATLLVTRLGARTRLTPGHHVATGRVVRAMAWLTGGSLLAQAVANAGPVLVQVHSPTGSPAAALFLSALVVARLPLFLFQAVQATLLPNFSALASHGHHRQFRAGVRRLVWACLALVAGSTCAAALLGQWVVGLLFGADFEVARRTITLLTAASSVYLLATALVNVVGVAAGRHHLATWSWSAAAVAFVVVVVAVPGLLLGVELAYLVAAAVAAVVAWLPLRGSAGLPEPPTGPGPSARSGTPPAPRS